MSSTKKVITIVSVAVLCLVAGSVIFLCLQKTPNEVVDDPVDDFVESTDNSELSGVPEDKLVRVDTAYLIGHLDVDNYTRTVDTEVPYDYEEPVYQGTDYGSSYIQLYTNQAMQTEETLRNYITVAEETMGLSGQEVTEIGFSSTDATVIIIRQYLSDSCRTLVKYVGTTGEDTNPGNIQVYAFKLEEH